MAVIDDHPEADIESSLNGSTLQESTLGEARTISRATEAKQIREQVEYYFSDENLHTDQFLLQKMKGRKNKPVPLKLIASFSKMRQYQPLSFVIESLESSRVVNVVKDKGDHSVQRKQPFHLPQHLKGSKGQNRAGKPSDAILWAKPSAATGFEQYFADAPLPADIAEEEAHLYDPAEKSFEERMETAIHRYMARRKWTSTKRNYLNKWMRFGGVDIEPKTYTSNVNPEQLEGLTNKEKKEAKAPKPYVAGEEFDDEGNPLWTVDFEAVCKAFLSTIVLDNFNLQTAEEYSELVSVMQNFLRYLLFHGVCPEYTAAINSALRTCSLAVRELPACKELVSEFPGPFNTAASTSLSGYFHGKYAGDQEWLRGPAKEGVKVTFGLGSKDASLVYAMGMLSLDKDVLAKVKPDIQHIVKTEFGVDLEIVDVLSPTQNVIDYYANSNTGLQPLGRLICKPWHAPGFQEWDLPPNVDESTIDPLSNGEVYEFALEANLLEHCERGMKIEAHAILTLAPSGLQILDGPVGAVYPSFYTILENELVSKWKSPRWISREELKSREQAWEHLRKAGDFEMFGEDGSFDNSGMEETDDDSD